MSTTRRSPKNTPEKPNVWEFDPWLAINRRFSVGMIRMKKQSKSFRIYSFSQSGWDRTARGWGQQSHKLYSRKNPLLQPLLSHLLFSNWVFTMDWWVWGPYQRGRQFVISCSMSLVKAGCLAFIKNERSTISSHQSQTAHLTLGSVAQGYRMNISDHRSKQM